MMPVSSKQLLFSLHLQRLKITDAFAIIHTSLLRGMAGNGGVKRNHVAQIFTFTPVFKILISHHSAMPPLRINQP